MAGPLSSERPAEDANLTGGANTSVSREMNQDFKQVKRTVHMDRPARTGTFGVNTASPMAKNVDQKARKLTNLRPRMKRKRFRK